MTYPDGANGIILDPAKMILVVKHNYGTKLFGLPGGEVEPGEEPVDTAVREAREETGLVIQPKNLEHLAECTQRRGSRVSLYRTSHFEGNLVKKPTDEISLAQFMSFEEIICRKEEFGTGYLRMIIMYMRCLHGLDKPVIERPLYDPIELDIRSTLGVLVRI
ncbi:MAG: NUDIX hydrolase [Minisyncoccota bacterium]